MKSQIKLLKKSKQVHSNWYREQYPDVALLGMDPAEHYLKYGAYLGRNPGKGFDTKFYLESYPDVKETGMNPLLHYVLYGEKEGRSIHPRDEMKTVRRLESKLWGGLGESAARELEQFFSNVHNSKRARIEAACKLATWYEFTGQENRAVDILYSCKKISFDLFSAKAVQMRLGFLHLKRGNIPQAKEAFERIPNASQDPDVLLAIANVQDSDSSRLECINKVYVANGLATIKARDQTTKISLGNITGSSTKCMLPDLGKVSVIMPAYNAAPYIETALRSLCEQTYQNIEIIVVDDCSLDDTFNVVQNLAVLDQRIKPIRQAENAGAYPARNKGLESATGAFLTTHDADDWSHPQKLERQLCALNDEPSLKGVLTHWARVRPSLHFTSNWRLSDNIIHWSHSSFLFRREVYERLGGWDNVRVSADTEFIWRVEKYFGRTAIKRLIPEAPMAFALDDESSLTRTKLTHVSTTYYGLRHYYREISRYWHEIAPNGLSVEERELKKTMLPRQMFSGLDPLETIHTHMIGDCSSSQVVRRMLEVAEYNFPDIMGVTHKPREDSFFSDRYYSQKFCAEFFDLLKLENVEIILPNQSVNAKDVLHF